MAITKIIDNFSGILTRDSIGDMNSGKAKYATTFGNDPFTDIKTLSWLEAPTQIDSGASVITDLIVAAKTRLEGGLAYAYAIGHTGRLYKIQVNNTSTKNPNYDTAVLLTTLVAGSATPTFKFGASIQFYGATLKIFVGHDLGVNKVNFDGTGEAAVGAQASYTSNVPRPSVNFLGKLYFGNASNLVEIDSTETVTSFAKISPAFPDGTYVRDLDINATGTYLQAIVSYINADDMTQSAQRTAPLASGDSFKALWNGTDTGITSYETYNGYTINSNTTFANLNYTLGYDLGGAAMYSSGTKLISLPNIQAPDFGAMFSTGNLLGLSTIEYTGGVQQAMLMFYGQYDMESPKGLFRFLRMAASSPDTDIIRIPVCLIVSNLLYGNSFSGYTSNQVGSAKVYFSTVEVGNGQTTNYRFYKFTTVPTGTGTAIGGVYETQQETSVKLFRNVLKRTLKVSKIRVYTPPLVTNNSFQIDLIGPGGTVIPNTTATFTVGTNVTAGATVCSYNPTMKPQYSVGLRVTNLGSVNWKCEKIEIEIDEAGEI